ncbi:MAG: Lrp/AsnC family transcriptional regulator [Oscillospiraceae bacterium]
MDNIDKKILEILCKNARASVKEIAAEVILTAPAVSERIKKMEKEGTIAGYTVLFGKNERQKNISAIISMSVTPEDKPNFLSLAEKQQEVERCYNVTGSHSYIVMVNCADMSALEKLIGRFQGYGQTSTQIVLSTPVTRVEYNFDF